MSAGRLLADLARMIPSRHARFARIEAVEAVGRASRGWSAVGWRGSELCRRPIWLACPSWKNHPRGRTGVAAFRRASGPGATG